MSGRWDIARSMGCLKEAKKKVGTLLNDIFWCYFYSDGLT